jgi:hypothetical protein
MFACFDARQSRIAGAILTYGFICQGTHDYFLTKFSIKKLIMSYFSKDIIANCGYFQ